MSARLKPLVPALTLWLVSLLLPAIRTDEAHWGYFLALMGNAVLLQPVLAFGFASVASWLANVALALVALFLFLRCYKAATSCAVLGLLASLLILLGKEVPLGPEFAPTTYTVTFGGYVWIASHAAAVAGVICVLRRAGRS